MSMKARLGDYIQEYSVRNRSKEDIPVYSVTNTQGFCQDYFGKEVASKDKSTYKIVPKGCFAYNPSRINVGSVDWQRYEDRVIVSPLYNVFSVSPQLNQQYLYYFLKSDYALQRIRSVATGSVRDNLKLAMLYEFPINLPSTEEQKEVVKKLDRVKRVISLREQELETLDDLVKARFVEMFGDPIENPRGWSYETMKSICKKITDGEHGSVAREEKGHPFLNAKHIKISGDIDWDSVTYTSDEVHERLYKRCNPEADDIVMTTTGTIGNVAVVPEDSEPFTMDRGITLLKLDKNKVKTLYIAWLLRQEAIQSIMKANIHASAIGHLFLNKVEQIPVMMPDMGLQDEFSSFVAQADKSKVVVQAALNEAQILFDSLMQEYFG
jgi:type I restriction enzyme S subunit